jgi:arginyl-tRNA synthetase
MTNLNQLLTAACQHLFAVEVESVLTIPEEQFGDYASNLALQLAGRLKQPPLQIAQQLKDYLDSQNNSAIANIEVIKPGFLNIFMSHQALWQAAQDQTNQSLKGQRILLEYSCPNPFKELHVGHLYNTIAGDSLSVLLARSGATVYRANFGGDVGLHVAKCLWGLVKTLGGEEPHKMSQVAQDQRANFLSTAYVAGAQAFEDDPAATQQIKKYNAAIYEFHNQDDHQSPLAQIYWLGRDWSYAYFKDFYKQLAVTAFDKFYPESAAAPRGLATVQAHRGSVFEDSDGAVVFKGQAAGLHTRVFIT